MGQVLDTFTPFMAREAAVKDNKELDIWDAEIVEFIMWPKWYHVVGFHSYVGMLLNRATNPLRGRLNGLCTDNKPASTSSTAVPLSISGPG